MEQQVPHLYRDLALYLQVLREVLPASLDQACSHLATQVNPRQYNSLHSLSRQQLHRRLKSLTATCCSLLTVEQLLSLAGQMAGERRRLAVREQDRFLESLDGGSEEMPMGSIHLHLNPPLSVEGFAFPFPFPFPGQTPDSSSPGSDRHRAQEEPASPPDLPWASGGLPRDPGLVIQCLDGLNAALSRRLRILSHSVNLLLMRAGLMGGVLPVPLLDAVLSGQIEPQGSPPNLLRVSLLPPDLDGLQPPPSLGVLLRTVDLEMEQPRLRTCRRRLQQHRQEILRMAETSHRLQRRLQAHHAERLWRHDSQLNPPAGT